MSMISVTLSFSILIKGYSFIFYLQLLMLGDHKFEGQGLAQRLIYALYDYFTFQLTCNNANEEINSCI